MFDLFRNMGQMAGLMRNLPKIQEEMGKMQERLGQITAEGDAGAGMVKVKVNGRLEVLSVVLTEDAMKGGDREMLETLIKVAANQALAKAREAVGVETQNMAATLGLPQGMKLPGMG